MKFPYSFIIVILIGCSNKKDTTLIKNNSKIEHIHKVFDIGDINNDSEKDSATIDYNYNFTNQEVSCINNFCPILIQFGNEIPSIEISYAQSIYLEKTPDLNNDGSNEILIFSLTSEGSWNNISVYSLQNNKWMEVTKTKGYLSENIDFKDRILQSNGKKYLLGDTWDANYDSIQMRSLKIEIN